MVVDQEKLKLALQDCATPIKERIIWVISRAERIAQPTTAENWDYDEARLHRRLESLQKELSR